MTSKNPRDNPSTFGRLQHSFATNHTVHLINATIWCWSDQDIADIYAGDEPSEISGGGGGVESWVPWVAGIGAPPQRCSTISAGLFYLTSNK